LLHCVELVSNAGYATSDDAMLILLEPGSASPFRMEPANLLQ
jgi:hypothetical protein